MANKILSDSFDVFTKYGYSGGIDDFQKLIKTNPDALSDAYEQYKNDVGFEGTIEEYAAALEQKPATVKKKEQEPSGMELPSEDGSSEQSTPQQPEPPKKPRTYGTLNLPGITGALRTGKPSAKELADIGEFAKKTGTTKEKPKATGKTPLSEGEVLSIAFQRVEQEEKEQEEVDKPKLVDPTLAAIPQKDVLRESPALTSKEQIQQKVAEAAEDAKATQQYKDKQRILTTLQFARDKEKEFEQRKEREQEAAELLASTDFNSLLNEITPGLINQEETKVASELTNRLGRFGFSFSEADPGFNAIYVTAKKSGGEIPSIQINLGDKDAEQKLKNFVKQYASKPYQFTPTDNQIDAEGQEFYAIRGLDYKNERARQDEYYNIRDKRIAAESIDPDDPTTYNETMRQKFPDLFTSTGSPRRDLDQLSKDLLVQEDALYATIFDKGVSRDVREQWDVELEKKRKAAAATAAIKNNAAKTAIRDLDVYLTSTLGITIDQLPKYKPKTQEEADIANEVIKKYIEAAKISKEAANQYQLSQLYFDEKVNKAVQGEYVDNLEGIYKSIHDGWKEGKTGQVLTLVAEGIYDRTDIVSARDAAQIIVDAQLAKYNQQSAVMGRADAAVSTREYIDAILEDPFEYVTTLFGTSIAQMLPTFMVIAPQTVTAGAAIGGLSTRTPQGAIGGAIGGLKRAQELTEFAVEIGSSFGEAMKNNKLDILNPNDVAFALNNEAIWGETVDLGAGRGIAIALTQFVANKIAGRVFKFDDYASQARKVGTQMAERLVVDPVTEGLGEAVAQLVSAGDIDFKEVSAEALGGTFSNVTGMAANIYMDTQGKANIEIADNLTNIEYVANETASDERISNWANNMHRLGKIDADVNQRIQENIGHKRSAENLLKVGESKRERKDKSPLVARMMKLLAAEKELSSTEERRKVFSEKLSAIRKEQAYIADKQQLAPDDAKVDVDAIIKEQPQPGNYSYNGRRMTKAQFTERIEKMSPQKLANAVARKRLLVTGDPEVVKTINDKLNAVQKPTTKEGVLRQERPEVELREMGERDAEGQAPQAPITYTKEEVTKRKDELTTRLEQLTKEAEAAPDDTELAGRVAEVKQQVAGMEAIGRRLETQENVKQSIKSVYPDLEVVEVNNAKEMEDYVAANVDEKTRKQMIGGEGGVIIFGADGKPESIIINNEVADSTTMPHEGWHGILFKAFGDNPELFAEFRKAIDKTLRDNGFGDIADRLDQFVAEGEYTSEQMAEEWLVELGGLLVSQGIDVKNLKPNEATLLQQIKDIINAFAERIIGQPVFLKDATPENILDFMVTISERMRKGESIADFFGEEGNVTKASTDIKASRKVFHGSPYDFERFDISKIGTGEGAQAFGWGLYFTDLESIAKGYAQSLSTAKKLPIRTKVFEKILDGELKNQIIEGYPEEAGKIYDEVVEFLKDNKTFIEKTGKLNSIKDRIVRPTYMSELPSKLRKNIIDAIFDRISTLSPNLYEVTLHEGKTPDQYTWLDWDKEIDDEVFEKIKKGIVDKYGKKLEDYDGTPILNFIDTPAMRGGSVIYKTLSRALGGDKQASLFLLENGIDGVRYPAESIARGTTSETARGFNYVVFDDKAVTIEKKVKFSRKNPSLQTVEATAKALEDTNELKAKSDKYFEYVPINEIEKYKEFDREKEKKWGSVDNTLEELMDDIRENGIETPITLQVDRNNNALVVEGNTRLAAAKKLGIKNIPVRVIDGEFGSINKEKAKKIDKKRSVDEMKVFYPSVKNLDIGNSAAHFGFTSITQTKNIAEAYHAAKKDGSNPELVNAVEELLGGEEKKVKFSRKPIMTDVVNGFYSPLENAVAAVKQDKMPAKQWMKYTNMEEAKWTGLNDWLSQQSGSLTKDDILKYLKDNRIEIREVEFKDKLREYERKRDEALEKAKELLLRALRIEYNMGDYEEADALRKQSDALKAEADDMESLISSGDIGVKYSEYQLGGYFRGNYKEVLVTLPNKSSLNDLRRFFNSKDRKGKDFDTLTRDEFVDLQNEYRKSKEFKSSHFDEPNILVHLRMNTRTDTKGNKVLFLEEVQSDWGQEGKKRGFITKEKRDKEKATYEIAKRLYYIRKSDSDFKKELIDELKQKAEEKGITDKDVSDALDKYGDFTLTPKSFEGVSPAPYVMNTSDWVKLGMKVALKEAEKQGADYIAWTTGEQQNERYDLRKQVDSILWERDDDGTYAVSAEKDGSLISSQAGLTSLKLEEAIGKDAAEKIVNSTDDNGVLEGNDLAVGGKGMKSFYDKIVPDVAKAVIKDVTGTPGEITSVTIETDEGKSTQMAIAVTPEVKGAVKGGMAKFSRKKKVDLSGLQGYSGVVNTANDMKQKGRSLDDVIAMAMNSTVYENATDAQREEIVRQMRELFGEKEKRPPSVAKLLGITDKKIEIKEKTALANQLKAEARGARNAVKAWKDRAKQLGDDIEGLVNAGKISPKQASAALRALVKVNMFNEQSIDRFIDYITKVFNNADYADKIAKVRSLLPRARRAVDSKIGVSQALAPNLKKLFSINVSLIPDDVFDDYVKIVEMLGERAAELSLEDRTAMANTVENILAKVESEQFEAASLKMAFDYFPNKQYKPGTTDISYSATIKQMLEDGAISADQYEVMKKYRGVIMPSEPPTPAEIAAKEAEKAQQKQDLIDDIPSITVDTSNLTMRDERDSAAELAELIKDKELLEALSLSELQNLERALDNINNGFYSNYAQKIKEKLEAARDGKVLANSIPKVDVKAIRKFVGQVKAAIKGGYNKLYEVIGKVPLRYIDNQLGNIKSSPIYNAAFKKLAQAQAAMSTAQKRFFEPLDKAADAVFNANGMNPRKTVMSEFKIFTYLLQREYESNPGNPNVFSAMDALNETIKFGEQNQGGPQIGPKEVEMLKSIRDNPKYKDSSGQIDARKLWDSMTKEEKAYIDALTKANNENQNAAMFTAAALRGDRIDLLNNYVHHKVLSGKVSEDVDPATAYSNSYQPSTAAGVLNQRSPGVKPLSFHVFSTSKSAINQVLTDYHMTEAMRTSRRMFAEARRIMAERGELRGQNAEVLNAIEAAVEKAARALLEHNLSTEMYLEQAVKTLVKNGYRAILSSARRALGEFVSNLSYAIAKEPEALTIGSTKLASIALSGKLVDIMDNTGSVATTRVNPSDIQSGRLIESAGAGPAIGRTGGVQKPSVLPSNALRTAYNQVVRRYKNYINVLADNLISLPDKAVSKPVWIGSFYSEFKNITGIEPDLDKIAANDEAYMNRYKDAIAAARDKADDSITKMSATDNPFMGILDTLSTEKEKRSAFLSAMKLFNNFLSRFMINEYVQTRMAIQSLVNDGSMSKKESLKLLVAITLRMTVYGIMAKTTLKLTLDGIFGEKEEDEEDEDYSPDQTMYEIIAQSFATTATSLMIGRDHGQAMRSVLNMGVEWVNKEYLDILREGKYDPHKDAIQYGLIPQYRLEQREKGGKPIDLASLLIAVAGPFSPLALSVEQYLIERAKPETTDEFKEMRRKMNLYMRYPFEILGANGYIPLYSDMRKIMLEYINRAVGKPSEKEVPWDDLSIQKKRYYELHFPAEAEERKRKQNAINAYKKMHGKSKLPVFKE